MELPEGVRSALSELQDIVAADGGRLELVAYDGRSITLDLVVEDASCADCIVPKEMLEDIFEFRLLREVGASPTGVTIRDPRVADTA